MTQHQTVKPPLSPRPNIIHFWFYGLITAIGTVTLSYLFMRFMLALAGGNDMRTELRYYQNLGVPFILLNGLFAGGIRASRRVHQPTSSTFATIFVTSFITMFLMEIVLAVVFVLMPRTITEEWVIGTVFIICGTGAAVVISGILLRLFPHSRLASYPRLINLLDLTGMGVGLGSLAGLLVYVINLLIYADFYGIYDSIDLYQLMYLEIVSGAVVAVLLGLCLGLMALRFQFKVWSLYLISLITLIVIRPFASAITTLIVNQLPFTQIFTVTMRMYTDWANVLIFNGFTILFLLIAPTGFAYLLPGKRVFGTRQSKPERSAADSQEQIAQAAGALAGLALFFVVLSKIFGGTSQNASRSQPSQYRLPVAPPPTPIARPNPAEQWQKEQNAHAARAKAERDAAEAAKQQQQKQAAQIAQQRQAAEQQRQAEMKQQKELEWQQQERERQAREQQAREQEERINRIRRQESDQGYRPP